MFLYYPLCGLASKTISWPTRLSAAQLWMCSIHFKYCYTPHKCHSSLAFFSESKTAYQTSYITLADWIIRQDSNRRLLFNIRDSCSNNWSFLSPMIISKDTWIHFSYENVWPTLKTIVHCTVFFVSKKGRLQKKYTGLIFYHFIR